eukprot:s1518_g1.t1
MPCAFCCLRSKARECLLDPFDPFDLFDAMDNSALTSTTPSDVKPESQPDAATKASSAASHEEKIATVKELTNATHQAAFQALLTFNWDVQMAVDKILNAHEATKQVLSQRNANPQAKSHHPPPLPATPACLNVQDPFFGSPSFAMRWCPAPTLPALP